jgi:ppGpp synthetase/RelA/SpoT-type nucleotidyltranferase
MFNDYLQQVEKVRQDYEEMKDALQAWGDFIDQKIVEYLENDVNFDATRIVMNPLNRVKTTESVINNLFHRKNLEPRSTPLVAIQDKIGTRIVLLTEDDVCYLGDLLMSKEEFWSVRIGRRLEKKMESGFDYRAIHLYLTPRAISLPIFNEFNKKQLENYICEVQIRTNLQHTLALVQHEWTYKNAYSLEGDLEISLRDAYDKIKVADDTICQIYQSMHKIDTYERKFFTDVVNIYAQFNRSLAELSDKDVVKSVIQSSDHQLNALFFKEFSIKNIQIQDIEKVCSENENDISFLINKSQLTLAKEPIVILLAYMVFKKKYTLTSKWFLSNELLEALFYSLGQNYEQ